MNLVIGNTSQLFPYFKEYDKDVVGISSRNINFKEINKQHYDNVFIVFAEQRTFLNEPVEFFNKVNVHYTLDIINNIKYNTDKMVVYLTSELWNQHEGEIDINTPFLHNQSPYIKSKEILKFKIEELREKENINIKMLYPFNFNSPYRKQGFLFSKFMDVILNKNQIKVGDLNFYRDIIHPKIIIETSYNCIQDTVVGSGILINIKNYYKDILNHFNINYNDYVLEDKNIHLNIREPYYLKTNNKYNTLTPDTIYDITKYKNPIS
jgi:nucleoside-diphosphate-sugar epimerase